MAKITARYHEPEGWLNNQKIILNVMKQLLEEGIHAIRPEHLSGRTGIKYTMFHFLPILYAMQDSGKLVIVMATRESRHQQVLVLLTEVYEAHYYGRETIPESKIIEWSAPDA